MRVEVFANKEEGKYIEWNYSIFFQLFSCLFRCLSFSSGQADVSLL